MLTMQGADGRRSGHSLPPKRGCRMSRPRNLARRGTPPMTDPMTAREIAERIAYGGPRIPNTGGKANTDWIADEIERAILADRAAERARLAQSGDVEGVENEIRLLAVGSGVAWRLGNDGLATTIARHVQAKLAATAEAARLEARDAIADLFDNGMYTKDGERWMKTPEGDVRLLDIAPNLERMFIQEQILKCGSPQPTVSERIRALRPDELEKKP